MGRNTLSLEGSNHGRIPTVLHSLRLELHSTTKTVE